jgi:murein tripeptide amidase MpaA
VSVFHNFAYDPKEPMHGAMDDYAFDFYGWFGFTTELWDAATAAGIDMKDKWIDWMKHHSEEDDLKLMEWNDDKMDGRAFFPWREFEHPQLGKVEIGGWDIKNCWQNAPVEYLPEMCEKHAEFTLAHALMSARLEFRKAEVEKRAEGVYRVEAIVANTGFLPTYTSKRAQERKIVQPIEVSLKLPEGAGLLSGKTDDEIGQLEGRTNKIYGGWFSSRNVTDSQRRLEWVLTAESGADIEIVVTSERGGTLRKTLKLE